MHEKVEVVQELRQQYPLQLLLRVAQLNQSTFYRRLVNPDKDIKNQKVMEAIKYIFKKHHARYGYRRITLELKNNGWKINHKKVQRLMKKMGLRSIVRQKRKYSSYKGTVGKIAENWIQRKFKADAPNKKWFTDITEFNLRGQKVYLSPIIDGFNQEVIAYDISTTPNLEQINRMLAQVLTDNKQYPCLILHTDQGWQYQHLSYQNKLKVHHITQSMSRKGNSIDKSEMFYGHEHTFKDVHHLINAIKDYIHYYNHKRIKSNLKGLSPVQYRKQSFLLD